MSKFETNPKHEIPMTETLSPVLAAVWDFEFSSFVLVSDFVLRISDLGLAVVDHERDSDGIS